MNIVTGTGGFIGKHFKNSLKNVLEVEIDDCFKLLEDFNRWDEVDMIVHQGALSSTTNRNVDMIYRYNIDFSIRLFEKAIKHGIPVKYASSASVYGNQEKIINPLNYYAMSKATVDYWVIENMDRFRHVQGFRYFNVYGEGEEHKGDQASPISKFTKQVRETGKLKLFEGSDKFLRDFVCVDDIVDVVLNNNAPSGIYDLGTGKPISFQEVADLVIKKEGGDIEYIPFPDHLKDKYQTYTCADNNFDYEFKTVEQYLLG